MGFLHSHGVCHRDLKSYNVLIPRDLRTFRVKICDFAFAKFKEQLEETNQSVKYDTTVGTPQWMAPEVLRGEPYSLKADVYSFGVIMWEALHRATPYSGLSEVEIICKVGMCGLRLKIAPTIPLFWRTIMMVCWREDAKQRPEF
eukprot:SAG31_NODE_11413_length_1033_cov_1.255889_1_plen_143_part_10